MIGPYQTPIDQAWLGLWSTLMRQQGTSSQLEKYLVPPIQSHRVRHSETSAYHISDILEAIDDYFFWLQRLRRADPEAFALYSRVGGIIMPYPRQRDNRVLFSVQRDERVPADPELWPSFFMASFAERYDVAAAKWPFNRETYICPRLLYFRKLDPKKCGRVIHQPLFGRPLAAIYEGCLFYTERDIPNANGIGNMAIGVNAAGELCSLRVSYGAVQIIQSRKSYGGGERTPGRAGPRTITVAHKVVDHAPALKILARERDESPDEFVRKIFFLTLSACVAAFDGVQVNVAKGSRHGRFGIPLDRTSYFFRDRNFEATVNGARRKIFHYVNAHSRLINGRRVGVREHYRGARDFDWKGTQVHLTIPGYHHPMIERMNFTAKVFDDEPVPAHMLGPARFGNLVRDLMAADDHRYGDIVAPGRVRGPDC